MDRPVINGKQLSSSKHRVERLKTLGNAIVSQVSEQVLRAIKEIDEKPN